MLIIYGARLHTCGPRGSLGPGVLLAEDGKILDLAPLEAISTLYELAPVLKDLDPDSLNGGTRRLKNGDILVDGRGSSLYPGFIDGHTHLGISEDIIGQVGEDCNESTAPVLPNMRAIDGVNPFDPLFAQARARGVSSVVTSPGSANVFGGTALAIKTLGTVVDDMVIQDPIAMKVALGENPKRVYGKNGKMPSTRMGIAALIRETILKARAYIKKKRKDPDLYDEIYEPLIPVVERRLPLKIHAHRADDIATAIRLTRDLDLKFTLDHATEGHLVADLLKENRVACFLGPTFGARTKEELRHTTHKTGRIFYEKGIKFGIITDSPVLPQGSLSTLLRGYIQAGLPREEAILAITRYPAEILDLDDRIGSLDPGKDADLVLMEEDLATGPYDQVLMTIIDGDLAFCQDESWNF